MTREEIREKFDAITQSARSLLLSITDPYNQKQQLYEVLDLLEIKYKKTNCRNCILDYFHMAQEELGIIEDASEVSNFNNTEPTEQPATVLKDDSQQVQTVLRYGSPPEVARPLRYVWPRPVSWKGHIINDRTPESVKREFHKTHKGFYIEQAIIPFNETN